MQELDKNKSRSEQADVVSFWCVVVSSSYILYPISYILADIGDIESYFLNPISYIAQDDGYIDSDVLYPISYIQIDIENTWYHQENPISYILYPISRGI